MVYSTNVFMLTLVIIFQFITLESFISKNTCQKSAYPSYFKIFQETSILSTDISTSTSIDDVIKRYYDEIVSLRGTPELVDRLENLATNYPGIELNIDLYRAIYPFKLDDFQVEGLQNLITGKNVIVSTPTGSGKTIIGELAIYFALMMGLRVAYTTPLKALSNQKFQDFSRRFGGDRVGLLTGDIALNRGAAVTVMTTEVFRNQVYDQDSQHQLSNLFMVCFDEFHYMNDPERGTVWEESVISCPSFIRILALSATMGNVDDIKGWISTIHGPTALVLSEHRPVPLRYLFALKKSLLPLFRDPNAGPGALNGLKKLPDGKLDVGVAMNPSILKLEEQAIQNAQTRMTKSGRPLKMQKMNTGSLIPKYSDVIMDLFSLKLLPAIVFIFSRVGCDDNAKAILQSKAQLLNPEEIAYVTTAINLFAKTNPEIPIAKSSVQMLKCGVGVHHAGLIPVWKAFIEDLFNANKIKVLFATETLAAGVNMPARTTVISSVTKRISSEIIKLKTSQLLQMAGRAGRRGKDEQGTVVILRNRFEDVKMAHKILISPTDGIKSHFKISYGLTVKLLETRSFDECKQLVERGFGSYLLQKRVKKKETDEMIEIEKHRLILQKYTLKGARDYFKLLRRIEKEKSNEKFLIDKWEDSDQDLVHAIVEYMPLGAGVLLKNKESGYFLGDVKWGESNTFSGFGVITKKNDILVVRKEHVKSFYEPEESIPARSAKDLLDVLSLITSWEEIKIENCKGNVLLGKITPMMIQNNIEIAKSLEVINSANPFPVPELPGSIIRQRMLITELAKEFNQNIIVMNQDQEVVIEALRYASALKDPIAFVNYYSTNDKNGNNNNSSDREVFAWTMFRNVLKLLQQFSAMDGHTPTELGRLVSSLSGDNELWAAMAIQSENMKSLNAAELAAVMCGLTTDGYKAKNAFFKYEPSNKVKDMYAELEILSWDLKDAQTENNVEFPVHLCTEMGGLVESWVSGLSWREMCKDTNMDQGDLCRTFRRTVELLKQIPLAYGVDKGLADVAAEAAKKMNRFPVADSDSLDPSSVVTDSMISGSGVGFGNFNGNIDDMKDTTSSSSSNNDDGIYGNNDDGQSLRNRYLSRPSQSLLLNPDDDDEFEGDDDDDDDDGDNTGANYEEFLLSLSESNTNSNTDTSSTSNTRNINNNNDYNRPISNYKSKMINNNNDDDDDDDDDEYNVEEAEAEEELLLEMERKRLMNVYTSKIPTIGKSSSSSLQSSISSASKIISSSVSSGSSKYRDNNNDIIGDDDETTATTIYHGEDDEELGDIISNDDDDDDDDGVIKIENMNENTNNLNDIVLDRIIDSIVDDYTIDRKIPGGTNSPSSTKNATNKINNKSKNKIKKVAPVKNTSKFTDNKTKYAVDPILKDGNDDDVDEHRLDFEQIFNGVSSISATTNSRLQNKKMNRSGSSNDTNQSGSGTVAGGGVDQQGLDDFLKEMNEGNQDT